MENQKGLLSPPKVAPKPGRGRSSSVSTGLPKSPIFTKGKTGGWQAIALNYHDQVLQEVEKLTKKIDDESSSKKATELLKQAQISPGGKGKITPETYVKKTEHLLTLLQRLAPQQVSLQAPPTKEKEVKTTKSKVGRLSSKQLQQLKIESTIMIGQHQSYDIPTKAISAVSHLGKGMAIPLCYPNDMNWDPRLRKCTRLHGVERNKLQLNSDAMDILQAISGPVCVIAIVGPCRSGKSYILSRLISSVGTTCHFHLGHEMDPKTMGIWMWDQPFKMKLKNFEEEVTIILLDTEGIDAANATDEGDSQIFTLSVLLSSLMIYNSMSVPKREDLNQMHFVANLSKSIQVQAGKSAAGNDGMKLADSNPRFMWLLRDVILTPTDKNRRPCHIKDYLLQKVLVDDAAGDETQKSIRQCILSFFCGFDAETLPPPSTDEHVMQNIEDPLYQKDISPIFLQKVEYVRKRIFNNCTPKRGFSEGSVIRGFQLAHMVQLYVEALNSPGGVPVIGSTWQRVLEATYTDGMKKALDSYKQIMAGVDPQLPMESEQLLQHHRRAIDESMKKFNKAVSLDSESELYQTYLDKLMENLAIYDDEGECKGGELAIHLEKNYSQSKMACQSRLTTLKQQHLDPLIENLSPETDFKSIETAFVNVVSKYKNPSDKKCVGPAKDEVLNNFIQEQEKQRDQLESQLSKIKNYDAEAKQRMKELKDQQQFYEQKQIEMNQRMEQSKKDQEAKLKAMNDRFSKDAENLKKENAKQIEEQEKRLRNMAEANLKKTRDENSKQLDQLRATMQQRERDIQQQKSWVEREMQRQRNEIQRLQAEVGRRSGGGGGGGCFVAGTTVLLTNGTHLNLEKQAEGLKIWALGGEVATITDEFVNHTMNAGGKIFGINDDKPFAALHHPFWTTEGWKSLDPEFAKEENPDVDFGLLQVGDTVFHIAQTMPFLYEPIKIRKFTFETLKEPTKIYGLHLDGPHSYHANGYAVMANYPVLTKNRVRNGMKRLSEEEKEKLQSAISSVKSKLAKVLGSWAGDAFDDMGLTKGSVDLTLQRL